MTQDDEEESDITTLEGFSGRVNAAVTYFTAELHQTDVCSDTTNKQTTEIQPKAT